MAAISLTPAWQVLTDGTNNGILSAPGTTLLYIGATAPTPADAGMPFTGEKIQVAAPAKSWVKTAGLTAVDAIKFNY